MDSISKLYEDKKYGLVLELTKTADDVDGLIYRILSFLHLDRYDDALETIDLHQRELEESKRKETFTLQMEILLHLGRNFEAFQFLDHYDSLPYLDYEFEEILKDYRSKILSHLNDKNKSNGVSNEEIKKLLKEPKNNDSILNTISLLKNKNINNFIQEIKIFLSQDGFYLAKTYLLQLLMEARYMDEVIVHKFDLDYTIVPYELDEPLNNYPHQQVIDLLEQSAPNPSVFNIAKQLLENYILAVYPSSPYGENDELLVMAFLSLSQEYLGQKDKSWMKSSREYDGKMISSLVDEIKSVLNDTSRL